MLQSPVLQIKNSKISLRFVRAFPTELYRVGVGAKAVLVVSTLNTDFTLLLLFVNYCVIFQTNNYKLSFAPPCISVPPSVN